MRRRGRAFVLRLHGDGEDGRGPAGDLPCKWLAVPWRGRPLPDTRRSDHAPFWDLGYPALMVTDTADLRNPHHHRAGDRIETLDLEFLTSVCTALIDALQAL